MPPLPISIQFPSADATENSRLEPELRHSQDRCRHIVGEAIEHWHVVIDPPVELEHQLKDSPLEFLSVAECQGIIWRKEVIDRNDHLVLKIGQKIQGKESVHASRFMQALNVNEDTDE